MNEETNCTVFLSCRWGWIDYRLLGCQSPESSPEERERERERRKEG